jgi:hypothetical protein
MVQQKGRAVSRAWRSLTFIAVTLSALVVTALHADRNGPRRGTPVKPANVAAAVIGPDVIVSRIDGVTHYTDSVAVNGFHAYAVGTTACNIGDAEAVWVQATNQHPVIAQSLFRYDEGRFEQIGQSWLKHGFCAVNGTFYCDICQPTDPICPALGIGCSDTYGPTLNGNPIYLGPKYQVNPVTGVFPFPHPLPTGHADLRGRLLAQQDDIDPALNVSARYYIQAQYITPDEPAWGTDLNNCSYRRVNFEEATFALSYKGDTTAQAPAIVEWAALDPDVELTSVDIPNDGRLYLACKTTQLDPATWSYEYALFNMNSDRAVGWFRLPVELGAQVANVGFYDVDYHSGEPYSGDDWDALETYAAVTWATQSFAVNANANALRWGTLYNFRLTSSAAPAAGTVVLGLFKPAPGAAAGALPGAASIEVATIVPGAQRAICVGDIVASATFQPPPDGVVDAADLAFLLGAWGVNPGSAADFVSSVTFAPPPDGVVDAADLAFLLGAWGDCD